MGASDNSIGAVIGWSCTHLVRDDVTFSMSVMAKHIEDLSQFLQSFGVAALALLFLPVLITALARNGTLALATSLLSFCLVDVFCCSCFCNQRSRCREWARFFLGGAGKHPCAWTDEGDS